jgi:3',5'-cyclic AMP phosphodiesterase CpdA
MRIAQLSDLHLNGSVERRERFLGSIGQAKAWGAKHLVLTGDLTANGHRYQFEELGKALESWGGEATIVPGNHDGRTSEGFMNALGGPLIGYAHTSYPGSFTSLGSGAAVLAVNTQYAKRAPLFMALGNVGSHQLSLLQNAIEKTSRDGSHLIVAMHHPPRDLGLGFLTGLTDRGRVGKLLSQRNVSVLCGHDHRALDLGNVHVAPSVATHNADPLRIYDVDQSGLKIVHRSSEIGSGMIALAGFPKRAR